MLLARLLLLLSMLSRKPIKVPSFDILKPTVLLSILLCGLGFKETEGKGKREFALGDKQQCKARGLMKKKEGKKKKKEAAAVATREFGNDQGAWGAYRKGRGT